MQFVWILTLTCFYIVRLFREKNKKRFNDECHTNTIYKYESILIYVMLLFIGFLIERNDRIH